MEPVSEVLEILIDRFKKEKSIQKYHVYEILKARHTKRAHKLLAIVQTQNL